MPGYVWIIDLLGLMFALIGFTMAFRQTVVRRLLKRPELSGSRMPRGNENDPLTYVLRISGIMIMVFGIVIGGMMTLIHLT